jgi:hypothetical protein
LIDEYYAGNAFANEGINMTQETNPANVKWKTDLLIAVRNDRGEKPIDELQENIASYRIPTLAEVLSNYTEKTRKSNDKELEKWLEEFQFDNITYQAQKVKISKNNIHSRLQEAGILPVIHTDFKSMPRKNEHVYAELVWDLPKRAISTKEGYMTAVNSMEADKLKKKYPGKNIIIRKDDEQQNIRIKKEKGLIPSVERIEGNTPFMVFRVAMTKINHLK